jgi:hypothetical protein
MTEENYFVISRLFSFDISFDTINILFIKMNSRALMGNDKSSKRVGYKKF